MRSPYHYLKPKVVALRKQGKTYGEIRKSLGLSIPKSTLSDWCSSIPLSLDQQELIKQAAQNAGERGLATAWVVNKRKRTEYIESVRNRVKNLSKRVKDKGIAKVALAMLYLGEGAKDSHRGSLMFGNSSPLVIRLFLRLLRYSYGIDENKFRCTLQCRADQNIKILERFWSEVTQIPPSQFYKAKIDPRTIGKPTENLEYKGVCRIDYFSGDIFMELQQIAQVMFEGPVA